MKALLVIHPGSLRDSLDALLYSMPDVELVAHASDKNSVVEFCQKYPDTLLVVDIPSKDPGFLATVPDVKSRFQQGLVVALLHAERDLQFAEEASPDLILRVGISASRTRTSIEELIRASAEASQ